MKRRIVMSLLAAAVLILAACGNKAGTTPPAADAEQTQVTEAETQAADQPLEPEYAGIYWRTWSEEIGGTVVELNSYIVLNEDGTGYWIAQDVGTLTWDESQVMLTVGVSYEIALTQEKGTLTLLVYEFRDAGGAWIPTAYEKIGELPAEIEEMIYERKTE